MDDPIGVVAAHGHDLLGAEQLGAEAAGLGGGAASQVGSADAGREAEIVLDLRAGPGLAARRILLDHQGAEPLRGTVDGGGKSRRTAAHDDEVVEGKAGLRLHPDLVGQFVIARGDQGGAVAEEDHRQAGEVTGDARDELGHRLVLLHVDPLVGDPVAGQELLGGVALR
jgi:hypothetical protein